MFLLFPLFVRVQSLVLVFICINLCTFYSFNHYDGEERAGCFTFSSVFGLVTVLNYMLNYKASSRSLVEIATVPNTHFFKVA